MAIKNVLVVLNSYPEPTSIKVVDSAVEIGTLLSAHLSAISCEVHVHVPRNFLANSVVNVSGMVAAEAEKSRANAESLLAAFNAKAEKSGVFHESVLQKCSTVEVPGLLVDFARLYDLTILPLNKQADQWHAESLIFGSGKPILILPETERPRPFELGTIAVAWDSSRAAARAVSDSLPLLEKANEVHIVTVFDEKLLDTKRSGEELAKNLSRHGVHVVLDKIYADGAPIGDVLETFTVKHSVDLLVMGAYGHSRFREFFLGGATKSMLMDPQLPIMLSH